MRGVSKLVRALSTSLQTSAEASTIATRSFAGVYTDNLTGVSTSGPAKWPPKDPKGEWVRTQERFNAMLAANPLPKDKPWEVDHHHDDHHDDHGHDDHGHGHGGSMDNKWYEDDQVLNAHEPAATRENPVMVTPYIRAFEEDGVWVVERSRDPTLEEEVKFRVMKLVTFFDNVDPSKISPAARFMDIGLDSLDVVELQMAIEEEFGVQIPDDLAEKMWSVDDCVHVLCNEDRIWGPFKEENIQKWADWYWHSEEKKGRSGW